jgi:hypothetical protein
MARKKPNVAGAVRARVLTTCQLGNADDVVDVPAELVDQFLAIGVIDTDPDAVAYAESLA